MSRHIYTVTYSIEVSPDVTEENVSEGAYAAGTLLENHIMSLANGPYVPDVDISNISVKREKR